MTARPMHGQDAAELLARRSVAVARGVIGAVVTAYSLSTGFGGLDVPPYARIVGGLAGAGFLISAVAEYLSGGFDPAASRRLIVFDVLLVSALLFAFIEDPGSYEYVVVAWVAVEAGTVFSVRRTLAVAGLLAAIYLLKDLLAVRLYGQVYDTAGIIVRVATFAAIALVTSSYATAMQSKRLLSLERGRASQLQELDQAKTMFIRAVAHDFRSPLAVVTGMAELIVGRGDKLSPDQLEQLSQAILKNGRKLESLVGDLMDSQRLSQGVLTLDRVDTDMASLVRAAIEDVDMKDHPVHVDLPECRATVDAPKMERVIENLLANAAKHTRPHTEVWVSLREGSGEVLMVVEDAGDGIPDDLKEEIFQPFVQGTENSPGTGVGLSLVRGITELHGGRAWVEDRSDGGSSFRVLLPKVPLR